MNKRLTSLILAVVMLLSLTVTAVPTFAAGTDNGLSLSKETASAGETFELYLKIPPITAGKSASNEFKIDFDKAVVAVTEWDPGENIPGTVSKTFNTPAEANNAGKIVVNYTVAGDGENLADWSAGKTYTCKFKVLDGATLGNTKFEITTYTIVGYEEDGYTEIDYTPAGVVEEAFLSITAAPKPATGISLNKSTLELTVGANETLVATVTPADTTDTVTWDTDRSDVATVDSTGKVTAVAPGTAVIAARAGEKSASCTVTVVAAPCTHTNKTNVDAKTSTCKEQGWEAYSKCNDCGQLFDKDGNKISAIPYLSLAAHKYKANEKKPEALKTAGTCKDKAIYLRSCEVCREVAPSEAWGTFYGDTDPNNHAGGTTTVNASEPDHKNQLDGYTGDTKCLGCEEIIGTGTSIPAGAHTPSSTWSSDGDYHWKTCSVAGCGVIIDGSKAAHTSTGANVATCQHKAVCDACNVEYGEKAAHNPASGWTSDASGHWHACQTAGCTEKLGFAAHTPDREMATETEPVKCSECDYEIAPALGMADYTIDLPVSLFVKLTGDKKPAKETFKFEIYDLGYEDAAFEIVNDTVVAENLEFDENGAAFVYGMLKIKVTGQEQLFNLTEGFKVRMVKGTAKGWTYASEQWYVEPFFKNDALDVGIAVKEIVDGEISETYANGMSFSLGYEAVTEPGTPQTGDNSVMGLWIALLVVSGAGATAIYSRKRKSSAK